MTIRPGSRSQNPRAPRRRTVYPASLRASSRSAPVYLRGRTGSQHTVAVQHASLRHGRRGSFHQRQIVDLPTGIYLQLALERVVPDLETALQGHVQLRYGRTAWETRLSECHAIAATWKIHEKQRHRPRAHAPFRRLVAAQRRRR
jgi:hypothetical protein